jgi:uncharacterized repeat protein (TIGR01451 family)
VKLINGQHQPTPPGPLVAIGSPLLFTYTVTNTGNLVLTHVTVTDSVLGDISCPENTLAIGASMTCTADGGAARAGHQVNTATVTGRPPVGRPVTATDSANYRGVASTITLLKLVNNVHAPTAPGPSFRVGTELTFFYIITNTGRVEVSGVALSDNVLGVITCPHTTLAPGASMTCTAAGGTARLGEHVNIGTASGRSGSAPPVSTSDSAHYTGVSVPVPPTQPPTQPPPAAAPTPAPPAGNGSLPFTGLDVLALLALAVGLVLTGVILRTRTRRGDESP